VLKSGKITAGLDEMFRGRHPCLVAIEIVSGYLPDFNILAQK